ncbi:unnamed protein product [Urochloa humidicola]
MATTIKASTNLASGVACRRHRPPPTAHHGSQVAGSPLPPRRCASAGLLLAVVLQSPEQPIAVDGRKSPAAPPWRRQHATAVHPDRSTTPPPVSTWLPRTRPAAARVPSLSLPRPDGPSPHPSPAPRRAAPRRPSTAENGSGGQLPRRPTAASRARHGRADPDPEVPDPVPGTPDSPAWAAAANSFARRRRTVDRPWSIPAGKRRPAAAFIASTRASACPAPAAARRKGGWKGVAAAGRRGPPESPPGETTRAVYRGFWLIWHFYQ